MSGTVEPEPGARGHVTVAVNLPNPTGSYDDLAYGAQIDLLAALGRAQAFLAAQQQKVLAAMTRHPSRPLSEVGDSREQVDKQWVREDVSCALRLPGVSAMGLLHTADTLVNQLPDTLTALESGALTLRHAELLAEAVQALPAELAREVEAAVLPKASAQTVGEFRRALRTTVRTLDPRSAEQRHHADTAERRV